MNARSDGGEPSLPSLSRRFSSGEINMDLTMCGLLAERADELARLYAERGNWNEVERTWFEERRSNRSTRGSSRKIYRVLTSRFKNAPSSLPNPAELPAVLDACATKRDEAQVLYLYLVADDALVRYAVHEYARRLAATNTDGHAVSTDALDFSNEVLDFSNEVLASILDRFEYADGTASDYADSTTERWCEGFRSVMREIGVLADQQAVVGEPPSLGEVPLLVATGYSYEDGENGENSKNGEDDDADGDDWFESPTGLYYLFQPANRWDELYDRMGRTDAWEFVELHGSLQLRPTDGTYSWIASRGVESENVGSRNVQSQYIQSRDIESRDIETRGSE